MNSCCILVVRMYVYVHVFICMYACMEGCVKESSACVCVNVFIYRPIHECFTFITKLHAYLNLPTAFENCLKWTIYGINVVHHLCHVCDNK